MAGQELLAVVATTDPAAYAPTTNTALSRWLQGGLAPGSPRLLPPDMPSSPSPIPRSRQPANCCPPGMILLPIRAGGICADCPEDGGAKAGSKQSFYTRIIARSWSQIGKYRLRDPRSLYIKPGFNQGDQQLRNAFSECLEVVENAVKSEGSSRATRVRKFVAMQPLKFVSDCGKLCASGRTSNRNLLKFKPFLQTLRGWRAARRGNFIAGVLVETGSEPARCHGTSDGPSET